MPLDILFCILLGVKNIAQLAHCIGESRGLRFEKVGIVQAGKEHWHSRQVLVLLLGDIGEYQEKIGIKTQYLLIVRFLVHGSHARPVGQLWKLCRGFGHCQVHPHYPIRLLENLHQIGIVQVFYHDSLHRLIDGDGQIVPVQKAQIPLRSIYDHLHLSYIPQINLAIEVGIGQVCGTYTIVDDLSEGGYILPVNCAVHVGIAKNM